MQTVVGEQGFEFVYIATTAGLVVYTSPIWFVIAHAVLAFGVGLLASAASDVFAESGAAALVFIAAISSGIGFALRTAHARERRFALDIARLEYEREQQVEAERARIADELHDIIAHDITLVSMHVRVLERVTDEDLRATSLTVIRESADQALADIRRMLRTVKDGRDSELNEAPDADAIDVTAALKDIQQTLTQLGATVETDIQQGLEASTSVKQALIRVLRETSTNIVKHAASRPRVKISFKHDQQDVWLTLANSLPPARSPRTPVSSSGYGLARLRERVTLLGGEFSWGVAGGLWTVVTKLPRR